MSFLAETETPQRRLERHADYTDLIRSFKDKREKKEKRTENSHQRNIYFWTSRESHKKKPYLGKEAY